MKLDAKNIFLVDGIGAIVSAFSLGIILPVIQKWIGMPAETLYLLSLWALAYGLYSLSCFWLIRPKALGWLKAILTANLVYCIFTLGLVIQYLPKVTTLGLIYFLLEIMIILGLVFYERKLILVETQNQ